ncbi:MAG TPA: hypothetical protein VFA26_25155, partial [Gemmataceae bacterium]|nr:hypothetical protein [Gemmataceae bacterium]
ATRLTDPEGKKALKEDAKQETKKVAYKATILEKPEGAQRPTKLTRTYEKARVTAGGKERTLPYEGKSVLIEKKGDRYQFKIEGGEELTGKDAEELNKEFNRKDNTDTEELKKLLIPKAPVAAGGTWKLDMAAVAKELSKGGGPVIDASKAKGTGKLVKAYRKDGKQYGVMEFDLDLPVTEMPIGPMTLPLEAGSKLTIRMTVDGCIDGTDFSYRMKGDLGMKLSGVLKKDDTPVAKLFLDMRITGDESRKELAKQ